MPSPPDPLVTVAELPRYGLNGAFLSRFALTPIEVAVETAGALGTMTLKWRRKGDSAYGDVIHSPAEATWTVDLDAASARSGALAGCALVLSAGTYVASSTYTVALDGTIVRGGGAIDAVAATRYDLRAVGVATITEEALTMMQDAVTPPLLAWGDDVKRRCADMVHLFLRRARGMTPGGAGAGGDDDVAAADAEARAYFTAIGHSHKAPPSVVDSATTSHGPIYRDPEGDEPRGW